MHHSQELFHFNSLKVELKSQVHFLKHTKVLSTDQDTKVVGESIFFKVEPSHSLLNGLVFMPTTCIVSSGEYSFAILDDQCPSSLVSGDNFGNQLTTDSYKYSYRAFTFNTEDSSMMMNTSCTIKVMVFILFKVEIATCLIG